jgi:hypothetical protein
MRHSTALVLGPSDHRRNWNLNPPPPAVRLRRQSSFNWSNHTGPRPSTSEQLSNRFCCRRTKPTPDGETNLLARIRSTYYQVHVTGRTYEPPSDTNLRIHHEPPNKNLRHTSPSPLSSQPHKTYITDKPSRNSFLLCVIQHEYCFFLVSLFFWYRPLLPTTFLLVLLRT